MASQKTKFALGLFLTSGMGIALLAVLWLGMAKYLEEGQYYATYFNESVQGLDVDSLVKYRGVSIGRVDSIGVASDARLIRVMMKIESGQTLDKDMVAQLKSVGITGSVFLELDRREEGEPDQSPVLSFTPEYPVVSSRPSNISNLLQGIDGLMNQIKTLDLDVISGKLKLTLDSLNQMIMDTNMKGIARNIETSLENAGKILDKDRWDRIISTVEDAGESLDKMMDKANRSIVRVEKTLARVESIATEEEQTIKEGIRDFKNAMENANTLMEKGSSFVTDTDVSLSQLRHHIFVIARNLEVASKNLDRLMEVVADHPSQLMFGEPPVPRKLEK